MKILRLDISLFGWEQFGCLQVPKFLIVSSCFHSDFSSWTSSPKKGCQARDIGQQWKRKGNCSVIFRRETDLPHVHHILLPQYILHACLMRNPRLQCIWFFEEYIL